MSEERAYGEGIAKRASRLRANLLNGEREIVLRRQGDGMVVVLLGGGEDITFAEFTYDNLAAIGLIPLAMHPRDGEAAPTAKEAALAALQERMEQLGG
jgi:hypothetical protein